MTINTIVCFFVLVQAETAPDVKVLAIRNFRMQKRIQKCLTRCVRTFTPHRTYHITIIIYLTQLNAGPEFRFGNFSISQVFTLRKNYNAYKDTCQQCSNYTVDFGEPISFFLSSFFFFYNGGGDLVRLRWAYKEKSYGGGGGGQLYIYVYIYVFF